MLALSLRGQQVVRLAGTPATLECYAVEQPRCAVIVCPGGSYCWLDYEHEGVEVAKWLQQNGISAYVLRYRVAGWWAWATHYRLLLRGHRYPDPLVDAQAAISYLADSLHLATIGTMGFSAGGHLALLTAISDSRVAFAAPVYPVVSMSSPYTHKRSRRALLGEYGQHKQAMRDSLSLEQRITPACPPVFTVGCKDDPVVDYHNFLLLDSALTASHVPHYFELYEQGGHGFAVRRDKGSPQCRRWPEKFMQWLGVLSYEL